MRINGIKNQDLRNAELPTYAVFRLSDNAGGYLTVRARSLKEARELRDRKLAVK